MSAASVVQVCISEKSGESARVVERATLREAHGLEGDRHAGDEWRQVSLVSQDDLDTDLERRVRHPAEHGVNLIFAGIDLRGLGIGSRLTVGDAELEVTQAGVVCASELSSGDNIVSCVVPAETRFARVVKSGEVTPRSPVTILQAIHPDMFQAGVLTVSDRCAAGTAEDTSGPATARLLASHLAARIAWTGVVPDDEPRIIAVIRAAADRGLDLLVTVGGSGCGPRDVTPEATRTVITREVPGLAEAMRTASARTVPHALLQRGVCGIRKRTLIINLPGSPAGAVENLEAVLPVLPHAIRLLRGETTHGGDKHAPQ